MTCGHVSFKSFKFFFFFFCLRWVHSECSSTGELPKAEIICLPCKDQQHPVAEPYTTETQTIKTPEETEGDMKLVQMHTDTITEEQTDLSDVPGQKGTLERGQAEDKADKETPMDLGKSLLDTTLAQT